MSRRISRQGPSFSAGARGRGVLQREHSRPDRQAGAREGTKLLHGEGFTRTGANPSGTIRGLSSDRTVECLRRAEIHAGDLGTCVAALRAPYRPRPGLGDPLMHLRRAVAICLRLEGFSARTIAPVLGREEKRVAVMIAGVPRLQSKPRIHDNWARSDDARGSSGQRWRSELSGIKRDLRRLDRGELIGPQPHKIPANGDRPGFAGY